MADINRAFTSLWGELVEELPEEERPEPRGHPGGGGYIRASGHPGTEKDAHAQDAGAAHGRGAGAPLDNRPLLPLLPILTQSLMATARRRGRGVLNPATVDIAWIGRASRGLQAVPGGWGEDLRVRRYPDPRQDLVADGWLSRWGSTNLNFSAWPPTGRSGGGRHGLRQMEELFEDDVSKSREVDWKSGQRQRVGPDRGGHTTDSGARRVVARHGDLGGPLQLAPSSRRAAPARPTSMPSPRRERRPARGVLLGAVFRPSPGHSWRWRFLGLGVVARSNLRSPTASRTGRSRARAQGWKTWNRTKI